MTELRVGPYLFKTKKAARDECKRVLNAYPLGATVEGQDAQFLLGVLERHGKAETKIGCGVASFQVDDGGFKSRCFWVTRLDGSRTEFSYRWCFEKPPDGLQRARFAFRCEIQEQVMSFKTQAFEGRRLVPCDVTGQMLDWARAHVDHNPAFHILRDRFLHIAQLRLNDIAVQPWRECEHRYLFTKRGLAQNWQWFHLENAGLRILSAEENVKRGGGE